VNRGDDIGFFVPCQKLSKEATVAEVTNQYDPESYSCRTCPSEYICRRIQQQHKDADE
jgi:hypothetical protein